MYQLVETIKIVDGFPQNLFWHQERFEYSFKKLFKTKSNIKIEDVLSIPLQYQKGIVKSRFLYDKDNFTFQFSEYKPTIVNKLKLIIADNIDYSLKYLNRDKLNSLFNMRGDSDDVLIVRHGKVTDTFNANIIFSDGKNWITPLSPLLKGTCRQRLLSENKIIAEEVMISDLKLFAKFKLINAMNESEERGIFNISNLT
jgi:4-amino-4-deoxychorismate lyase